MQALLQLIHLVHRLVCLVLQFRVTALSTSNLCCSDAPSSDAPSDASLSAVHELSNVPTHLSHYDS